MKNIVIITDEPLDNVMRLIESLGGGYVVDGKTAYFGKIGVEKQTDSEKINVDKSVENPSENKEDMSDTRLIPPQPYISKEIGFECRSCKQVLRAKDYRFAGNIRKKHCRACQDAKEQVKEKQCITCKQYKPKDAYGLNRHARQCLACHQGRTIAAYPMGGATRVPVIPLKPMEPLKSPFNDPFLMAGPPSEPLPVPEFDEEENEFKSARSGGPIGVGDWKHRRCVNCGEMKDRSQYDIKASETTCEECLEDN